MRGEGKGKQSLSVLKIQYHCMIDLDHVGMFGVSVG